MPHLYKNILEVFEFGPHFFADSSLANSKNQTDIEVFTPIDGTSLGVVTPHSDAELDKMIAQSSEAFEAWKTVPAPVRGELIRLFGDVLRDHKESLGRLVTLECGKILSEGLGEVQEMIDICDLAVGQSRQLFGLTIASERPGHHMRELWHPLGPVGIISAFNFPVAVWAWNAALAIICGNSCIWKPSEITPLTALACQSLFDMAVQKFRAAGHNCPEALSQVVLGRADIGVRLTKSLDVPLISATGSTRMGREVAPVVAARFGRSILELGGNNAMIVAPSADIDMAVRAILFSAVGTCGQRCTSLRRLFVHKDIKAELTEKLCAAYRSIPIGNPLEEGILVGPLIHQKAFEDMQNSLAQAKADGGKVLTNEIKIDPEGVEKEGGFYPAPTIVEMSRQSDIVRQETFAPLLYVMEYEEFDKVLALHNDVPQGLSSCIFTNDVREAESFLSAAGSDCGIANVNIGPSGAEIGGAFGGEKETGGGRESGSDSWKAYMRRQTQTVNYSKDLPLAQGVKFGE